jgi:hypothetical protein
MGTQNRLLRCGPHKGCPLSCLVEECVPKIDLVVHRRDNPTRSRRDAQIQLQHSRAHGQQIPRLIVIIFDIGTCPVRVETNQLIEKVKVGIRTTNLAENVRGEIVSKRHATVLFDKICG